jgi:hypothetical protein
MKVVAFINDCGAVDRIIDHPKMTVMVAKPPSSHVFDQVVLMVAKKNMDYL